MGNLGVAGDIVVTNYGDSEVRESCFNSASSMAPGTIFIQDGSSIQNMDNFGYQNTVGGYKDGGTCVDVFVEMKDSNCIVDGSMNCNGICQPFTLAACPLDTGDKIRIPYYNQDEGSDSTDIVSIIVAAIVSMFVVFGFIGIIMRRRKALIKDSHDEQSGGGGIFCCRRNNRGRGGTNDEEMDKRNYPGRDGTNDEEMDDYDYDENVP